MLGTRAFSRSEVSKTKYFNRDAAGAGRHTLAQRLSAGEGPRGTVLIRDVDLMKAGLREEMLHPPQTEADFYDKDSFWTYVAVNSAFKGIMLLVILLNSVWLVIDVEYNQEDLTTRQHWIFPVADHTFCSFYFVEWLVRFSALKVKRNGFRDKLFGLDSLLAFMIVLDTWVFPLFLFFTGPSAVYSDTGTVPMILKLFRMIRLARIARLYRLMKMVPEVMLLVRGIMVAARSVLVTLFMLVIMMYIFTITLMELTRDTALRQTHFPSVGWSMLTLLLRAIIPDQRQFVEDLVYENPIFGMVGLLFILLGSLTLMNMLVGILVEVVSTVSAVGKEQVDIEYAKRQVMLAFGELDVNNDGEINVAEVGLLLENPTAAQALGKLGVDVHGLLDTVDFIFKDHPSLPVDDFLEVVLQLRGSNVAKVKDIIDLRRFVLNALRDCADEITFAVHEGRSITRPRIPTSAK